jgi:hypothetical protein
MSRLLTPRNNRGSHETGWTTDEENILYFDLCLPSDHSRNCAGVTCEAILCSPHRLIVRDREQTEKEKLRESSPTVLPLQGLVRAQSPELPIMSARFRSQITSRGVCRGQSDSGTGFLRVLLLPGLIPSTAPHRRYVVQYWQRR